MTLKQIIQVNGIILQSSSAVFPGCLAGVVEQPLEKERQNRHRDPTTVVSTVDPSRLGERILVLWD
jgi:hypothetical protein